jgi:D-alanine-D-alanine ligase-like ATP-grasp enzyme
MKRVGIIRGGIQGDYDASLKQGGEIISHIFENLSDKWKVLDVFIDKGGVWHISGIPLLPADLVQKVDVVWNVSHPSISNIIESLSIPQINISSFSFLLKQNSDKLAEHIEELGLKMPKKIVLPLYQPDFDGPMESYVMKKAKEVHQKFSAPWVVRTYTEDLTMGVHLAKTFPELMRAIEDGVHHNKSILIEEFIYGKSASMHSVSGFRDKDIYVFPPSGEHKKERDALLFAARDLHEHIGVEHYLKSDFTIHPKRGIFVTDITLTPDLKEGSHLHTTAESVGAQMHHIVEHMLEQVLK